MKQRLDVFLQQNGFFESRSRAALAVSEGKVKVNGATVTKSAFLVDENDGIVIENQNDHVSRAYKKLDAAINIFGIDAEGLTAVDIGASTGGFTQCLLKHGAKKVYAVDVGTNQLHPSLKSDPRVVSMESTNARTLKKDDFPDIISLAVMDVSFISQSKLYQAVGDILPSGGILISLVKPQFEVGKENIGKNGIVKDKDGKLIERVKTSLIDIAAGFGLIFKRFADSPIKGGDGNSEYLCLFVKE